MPIRFRCVYCNQLLGISRRKAGTIVRCTSCDGQLIVPDPSDAATEAAGSAGEVVPLPNPAIPTDATGGPVQAGRVFEDDNFPAFLEPVNGGAGGAAVANPSAPLVRRSGQAPVRPTLLSPPSPAGAAPAIVLSRRGLTLLIVAAVLGLGLSFAAGLWTGLTLQ